MHCRYSPIGPIKILQKLQEANVLENYLLLLAHDVIGNEADYVFLLDEMVHPKLAPELVIMDNGVIELGKAMPFEQVIEAADIATAECIVMPDVLGDLQATQQAVKAELSKIDNCDYPIMKVPQGANPTKVIQCIEWLIDVIPTKEGHKDYWGIPRWIANKLFTRSTFIDYINRVCQEPQIHLLGMSDNWVDDVTCAHMPNVIGIDSANPLVVGLMDTYLGAMKYQHVPREDYWEQTDINYNVLRNIEYVRKALN